MHKITTLSPGNSYDFAILNIDIVGSSTLSKHDSTVQVQQTKSNLADYFTAMVSRFEHISHISGDGFFYLFPTNQPVSDFDHIVQLATDLIQNMSLFNGNHITGNLLSSPIKIRMTGHVGGLLHDSNPGKISGGDLDLLLKHERLVGKPNYLTISDALYSRIVDRALRRKFQEREGTSDPAINKLLPLYDFPREEVNPAKASTEDFNSELERLRGVVTATLKAFAKWDLITRQYHSARPEAEPDLKESIKELKDIDDHFHTDYEDVWIADSKRAIMAELETIEFNVKEKVAYVYPEEGHGVSVIRNLVELRNHLIEVSNQEFYSSVPFDGGAAVWDDNSEVWVDEALATYSETLELMGWD